jgi:hypothetical protein
VRSEEGGRWCQRDSLEPGRASLAGLAGRQLAAGTRRPVLSAERITPPSEASSRLR